MGLISRVSSRTYRFFTKMSCCSTKSKCCETSMRLKQHLYMVVPMKNPLVEESDNCQTNKCCDQSASNGGFCESTENKVQIIENREILETGGLSEELIESVVQQSGSSRNQAILALKNNN